MFLVRFLLRANRVQYLITLTSRREFYVDQEDGLFGMSGGR